MSGCYDRVGKPLTLEECMNLFKDREYKRVAWDQIGDAEISTVWLGMDHNYFGEGLPIIFETLVFPKCDDMERYATEAEALEGHARYVAKYTAH